MNQYFRITNLSNPEKCSLKAISAANFQSRLVGYLRKFKTEEYNAIYFSFPIEGRITAAIHTFFINKPLLALWFDQDKKIVDKKVALPWGIYVPVLRSKYLLETTPTEYNFWNIGDSIELYEI